MGLMYFIYIQYFKYPLQINSEHSADRKVKSFLSKYFANIDRLLNKFIQNGRRDLALFRGTSRVNSMRDIFVGNLTIIVSDNGLSPGRRQAFIWTNDGVLLIGPFGENFIGI